MKIKKNHENGISAYIFINYLGDVYMDNNLFVLVLYKLKEVKPYICLSNFLRLCGIVVEEKRLESGEGFVKEQELEKCTCVFLLSEETIKIESKVPFLYIPPCPESVKDDRSICSYTVKTALELLYERDIVDDEIHEGLLKVAEVYRKTSLRVHEYNFQQYFYDEELMKNARNAYQKAEEVLFNYYKEVAPQGKGKEALLVQYSRCFSAVRIVAIEKQFNMRETYDASLVKRALHSLVENDKNLVWGYWLLGQLSEIQDQFEEAIHYYEYCMEIYGRREGGFVSDILYRIGKIYESKNEKKRAAICYEEALRCHGDNYRAEYKVIVFWEFVKKQYTAAINGYYNMIRKFEELLQDGYLQPMELEYLFKLYFRCGRLFLRRMPDMQKARAYFEKAEGLGSTAASKMKFMQVFYGEEAEKYLKKTLDRFPMYQIRINKQETEWNESTTDN